jgi:hypothetical protein
MATSVLTVKQWIDTARELPTYAETPELLAHLQSITPDVEVHYSGKLIILSPAGHIKSADSAMTELQQVCNGIVLEYPGFRILAIPPPTITWKYSNAVWNNISKYTIYEALDGSVVTLYYTDAWHISSANSACVDAYTRLNPATTYMQAVDTCLRLYPKFKWENLSKDHCYNIGFKHYDFHPLGVANRAWLVATHYVGDSEPYLPPTVGIPAQPKLQQCKNVRQLIKKNTTNALQSYLNGGRPNYGYVLALGHARILVESTLMSNIRNAVYNLPKGLYDSGAARSTYFSLRAYLRVKTRITFIKLFPQYKALYESFDTFFKTLTMKVMKNDISAVALGQVDKFAAHVASKLRTTIDISNINSAGVITDFLLDYSLLGTYMPMILAA